MQRIDDLDITDVLRLRKHARVEVQRADGSFDKLTDDEVRTLFAREVRHEVLTAAKTLTASDTGRTYYLDLAAGFAITLPTPQVGLEFEFVVKTAPTGGNYAIGTAGGADIMKGLIQESETDSTQDGPTDQNADVINLVQNVAVAGDYLRLRCDGSFWYFEGMTAADGGVTTATT